MLFLSLLSDALAGAGSPPARLAVPCAGLLRVGWAGVPPARLTEPCLPCLLVDGAAWPPARLADSHGGVDFFDTRRLGIVFFDKRRLGMVGMARGRSINYVRLSHAASAYIIWIGCGARLDGLGKGLVWIGCGVRLLVEQVGGRVGR